MVKLRCCGTVNCTVVTLLETHDRRWGRYSDEICQAIIRELPKTFGELRDNSPTLRTLVGSERTLTEYLKYLRRIGTVRKIVDVKTDKLLYVSAYSLPMGPPPSGRRRPDPIGKMLRQQYDVSFLYWGGQEQNVDGWWSEVRNRSRVANTAMDRAIRLWFRKYLGEAFERNPLEAIVHEFGHFLLSYWGSMLDFYLDALFGEKGSPTAQLLDMMIDGVSDPKQVEDQHRQRLGMGLRERLKLDWYQHNPTRSLIDELEDHTSLLALGIKAGYFTAEQVRTAMATMLHRFDWLEQRDGKPFLNPDEGTPPVWKLIVDLRERLDSEWRSEDPVTRQRAMKILGINQK